MKRLLLNSIDYIKPFFISKFLRQNLKQQIVWIKKNTLNTENVKSCFKFFLNNFPIFDIPDLDTSYSDLIKPNKSIILQRTSTLYEILTSQNPKLVMINEDMLQQQTISPENLMKSVFKIEAHSEISEITQKLTTIGYTRQDVISSPGEFALRGDILDIFIDKPYRISASFSQIEKIKELNPLTQLTFGSEQKTLTIFPVTEIIGNNFVDLISYINNDYLVFQEDTLPQINKFNDFFLFSDYSDKTFLEKKIFLNHKEISFDKNNDIFDQIKKIIHNSQNKTVIISTTNIILAKKISHTLYIDIDYSYNKLHQSSIGFFKIEKSFETDNILIISDNDIVKDPVNKITRKIKKSDLLKKLESLSERDLVIHINHGLGRFIKLVTLLINTKPHDFLEIEYAEKEKLFLPVENFNLLSKYTSDTDVISLDKLGSKSWERKKSKIKSKIQALAAELIKTAAERAVKKITPTVFDKDAFQKFCNAFEHVETTDQNEAINDVMNDLKSGKVMDRLICGDVGFGKTEIAMRAAFLVSREKQVAVLVPTTILCRQHFNLFQKRFAAFDTKIVELSRMSSEKDAIPMMNNGIIIGTHGVFRQKFHNLGMLIIDEEQHFGVKQKEILKTNYPDIHILTMSATPIPRTLQLSISGIKDISLIATPPFERKPTRILITPIDFQIIAEAITRETVNNGQVFYTCPYIRDIPDVEKIIQNTVPHLKYKILHGRMEINQINDTIQEFRDNKFHILISTNIIKSGVDIKNVSTIIIHNAHMFGLASLYQLRGRVGRSSSQSFTYITVPNDKPLTAVAEKRLQILQRLENLGSGFSLASYDMDMRGSGNILGEEQSGHIREIGIELYQKMLKNAIESKADDIEITINLNIPILIPNSYITSEDDRLFYYQKISEAATKQEIFAIKDELLDYFGKIPQEVINLLYIVNLKLICKTLNIIKIDSGTKGILIEFSKVSDINKMLEIARKNPGKIEFRPDNKVFLNNSLKLNDFLSQINK